MDAYTRQPATDDLPWFVSRPQQIFKYDAASIHLPAVDEIMS